MNNNETGLPAKILVIDDEENIRNLLCETLRLVGFNPVPAKSGTDAISLIRKEKFDLALLKHADS